MSRQNAYTLLVLEGASAWSSTRLGAEDIAVEAGPLNAFTPWRMTERWCLPVRAQLGMLQEGAEQAQRQEAAAKAVLKAAQVGPICCTELAH
jgi:hypothetical protein